MNAALIEEAIAKTLIYLTVLLAVGSLLAIILHILKEGLGVISWEFLTSLPRNNGREGGIFPSIAGTLYLIAVALAFAAPVGILAAINLAEYTRKGRLINALRFATDALAGVPSIIFGLLGFAFLVIFLGFRWSILSGGLTLGIMILPTIIKTSEEAIKSVPIRDRECSLALGAGKWQTVYRIVLPAAAPGIATGVLLGTGRAVGETAALLLTAGSSLSLPTSLLDPSRSLSIHLYTLALEGTSMENAYGTATVLIFIILAINVAASFLMSKMTRGASR
ncbi:MAG: phosphate ABC transporter permease [Peptococcaceae bacterium BICA1-7]|nr:MAG: phosphate ABC transporter permease [Peptococcaceae bacterium BICA1-7]HBV96988.1 phosphate ABC transporter permease PtsA [Desulfotomaculum sp.]